MKTETKHQRKNDGLDPAFYKILIFIILIGLAHYFAGI